MPIGSEALELSLPRPTPEPCLPLPEAVHPPVVERGALHDGVRVDPPALAAEPRTPRARAPDAVPAPGSNGDAAHHAFVQVLAAAKEAGYREVVISR